MEEWQCTGILYRDISQAPRNKKKIIVIGKCSKNFAYISVICGDHITKKKPNR
jgi:hypothetical protein